MRWWCFGVIAFLLCGSAAFGDGCYIPERAVKKIPDIVAQRAVLSWKDGVETLIIASALDSQSQQLGWIIPVPAVPKTIEKATPGSLKTLDFCIQPRITHDISPSIHLTLVALLVVNLLSATWLLKRQYFGCLAWLVLMLLLLYGLLLPAVNVAGSDGAVKASRAGREDGDGRLLRRHRLASSTFRRPRFVARRERLCRPAGRGQADRRRLYFARLGFCGDQAFAERIGRECPAPDQAGIRQPDASLSAEAHGDRRRQPGI